MKDHIHRKREVRGRKDPKAKLELMVEPLKRLGVGGGELQILHTTG